MDLRSTDELHMAQPVLLLQSNNRLILDNFGLISQIFTNFLTIKIRLKKIKAKIMLNNMGLFFHSKKNHAGILVNMKNSFMIFLH